MPRPSKGEYGANNPADVGSKSELFGQALSPTEQRLLDYMASKTKVNEVRYSKLSAVSDTSEKTINNHMTSIFGKLGVDTMEQLTIKLARDRFNNSLAYKDKRSLN